MAMTVETQLLNEIPLRSNAFLMTLNQNCIVDYVEKLVVHSSFCYSDLLASRINYYRSKTVYDLGIDEYLGKSIFLLVHPQDLNHVKTQLIKCKSTMRLFYLSKFLSKNSLFKVHEKEQNSFNYRVISITTGSSCSSFTFCHCTAVITNLNTTKSTAHENKILLINEIYT